MAGPLFFERRVRFRDQLPDGRSTHKYADAQMSLRKISAPSHPPREAVPRKLKRKLPVPYSKANTREPTIMFLELINIPLMFPALKSEKLDSAPRAS